MRPTVLLCNPPASRTFIRDFYCTFSSKAGYYWPPQDLIALSGILRGGCDIKVLDAAGHGLSESACFETIERGNFDALIFSTGPATFAGDIAFVEKVKRAQKTVAIGSSSMFRFIGREVMEEREFLDAVITDFTDPGIFRYLTASGGGFGSLLYREGKDIRVPKEYSSEEEIRIGLPCQELFIAPRARLPFFGNEPFATVVSSVGCSFSCAFCVAGTMKLRKRPLPELSDELRHIRGLGIRRVFFADPLFTTDTLRISGVCEMMRSVCIGLEWVGNAHAATLQDESVLKEMRAAGCRGVMIGVESASDGVLKQYKKGATVEQARKSFRLCRKTGIRTLAYFIIGLPGENEGSIKDSISLAKTIGCDYASFSFATPDHGTELRKKAAEQHWITDRDSFDSSARPGLKTDELPPELARKLFRDAYRQFYLRFPVLVNNVARIRSVRDIFDLTKGGWEVLKKSFW